MSRFPFLVAVATPLIRFVAARRDLWIPAFAGMTFLGAVIPAPLGRGWVSPSFLGVGVPFSVFEAVNAWQALHLLFGQFLIAREEFGVNALIGV